MFFFFILFNKKSEILPKDWNDFERIQYLEYIRNNVEYAVEIDFDELENKLTFLLKVIFLF